MMSLFKRLDDELAAGPRRWTWRVWLPVSVALTVLVGAAAFVAFRGSPLFGLVLLGPYLIAVPFVVVIKKWSSVLEAMWRDGSKASAQKDVVPRWVRWVVSNEYLTSALISAVFGLAMSAAWTATDYQFQWNNFLLRALVIGGAAFGVVAWAVLSMCQEVDRFDRHRRTTDRNGAPTTQR